MATTAQRLTQLETRQKAQELRIRALEAQAHVHLPPDVEPEPVPVAKYPPDTTLRYVPINNDPMP